MFSRRVSHKNTLRPKVGNPIRKPKVCVSLRASVILQSRTCHRSSEIGVSIFLGAPGSCRSAQQTMPLIFKKVSFPSFWALNADVLPFCQVEHADGLQKVAFPSFWALEAPVVLHSRTGHWSSESGVSIFLGARGSCRSAQQNMPLIFSKSRFHLSGRCTLTSCRSAK